MTYVNWASCRESSLHLMVHPSIEYGGSTENRGRMTLEIYEKGMAGDHARVYCGISAVH